MDDAARRELADLRRRAYGRGGGLDDEPEALARLMELEAAARSERAGDVTVSGQTEADMAPAAVRAAAASVRPTGYPRPVHPVRSRTTTAGVSVGRSHRFRWPVAIGGIAVVATIVFAVIRLADAVPPAVTEPIPGVAGLDGLDEITRDAYTLAREEQARVLLRIPLDGSFGNYIDLPTQDPVPTFPASGAPRWTAPLGEYYGWRLWIAGTAGAFQDEHCILLENGTETRGRCVPAALRENAALAVTLDYDLLPPGERTAFAPGERVGFWWHIDREVTVLLAQQEAPRPESTGSPSD